MQKNHTIWIWKDGEKVPRHVGYGRFGDKHPALVKWEQREDDDSELGEWLRSYDVEPERDTYGPRLVSLETAIAAVLGLRDRFKETLLKTRGPNSWRGGHPSRRVYYINTVNIEQSEIFDSVRHAARETGKHAATITRWCSNENNVSWGYIDESEE